MAYGLIAWASKKQPIVALSSMEAKYMAKSLAACQILWIHTFLKELGIPHFGPTILNIDNQSTIKCLNNSINHSCTKHIDIQHHFMQENLISGEIDIQYCASNNNLADLLTKALPQAKHEDLVTQLGMAMALRGSVVNTTK
jgi:hypothetical protein